MHLAKTGGTTFVGHLYEHIGFNTGYFDQGPHGNHYRQHNSLPEIPDLSQAEKDGISVIGGHLVYWGVHEHFPKRDIRYITFIREPVSRVISHYTFDSSGKDVSFEEWYKTWIPNQMCVFYFDHLKVNTPEDILKRLESFWHIAFTSELDYSLEYILKEMNLPLGYKNRRVAGEKENSTKDLGYSIYHPIREKYIPTQDEIKLITEDHQQDISLYEHLRKYVVNGKYIPSEQNE